MLERARSENFFRCADGSTLGSVFELENRLRTMGSEEFNRHVNQSRNDFHNWIKDVFHDYELANDMLKAKAPAQAAAIIRKHLIKELTAREEIESAISQVVKAPQKSNAGKAAKRQAVLKIRRISKPKNRKVNKKRSTQRHIKTTIKQNRSRMTFFKKRTIKKRRSRKRGKVVHRRAKKRVNKWLNWLKISPEL